MSQCIANLREVRLYGETGRRFGRVHWFQLDSDTPAEAIRALIANMPEIEPYLMQAQDRGIGFTVFRGKQNMAEKELTTNIGEGAIRIAPVILGSKSGGIFQVILGAILVIVGALGSTFGWWAAGDVWGPALISTGIGLMAGGVVSLLTPTPKGLNNKEAAANQSSYAFSGAVNTQAQGNPGPLLYGEMIVGSAVISAGISNEDLIATQGATSGANGGMGGGGCVGVDSFVHVVRADGSVDVMRAGEVREGDILQGADPSTLEPVTAVVTYSETVMQPCVEIETAGGVRLACSRSAPIPVPDGLLDAPNVVGAEIAARDGLGERWEEALIVRDIGHQWVQHISIDDGCFWAGVTADAQVLHHNKQARNVSPS